MIIKQHPFTLSQKNWLLLFALAAVFIISIFYGYWFENGIGGPPLSAKYATIPALDEGVHAEKYEISPMFSRDFDVKDLSAPFYDEYSKTIIIMSTPGVMADNRGVQGFYKIDSLGKLTDSLIFAPEYRPIHLLNGFILHPDYYTTWWRNGDTTTHPYLKETDATKYQQLKAKAEAVYYLPYKDVWKYGTAEFKQETDVVLFLINRQWHALYGPGLYQYKPAEKVRAGELPDLLADSTAIVLEAVKKESLIDAKADSWFGTGYLYFTLQQDTLRFKHEMVLEGNKGKEYWRNLHYYHAGGIPFALLYSNDRYYGVRLKTSLNSNR